MDFLFSDNNLPFSIALTLMLIIAFMEGVLTLLGIGMSQALDSLMPDVNLDIDADFTPNGGALSNLLGWIRFGQVPVLVMFVVFLNAFGLIGLALQMFLDGLIGFTLPVLLAAPIAFIAALPVVRVSTGVLSKVVFKDETESISSDTFVGRIAMITLGKAKINSPAEARFKDRFGTTHYVMVEPMEDVVFEKGDKVLLVESAGAVFKVIEPKNPNLSR